MVPLAGPTKTIQKSMEPHVSLASRSSDQGVAFGGFSGERAQTAKLEGALTNFGPKLGIYNPRQAALLTGEL